MFAVYERDPPAVHRAPFLRRVLTVGTLQAEIAYDWVESQ
jgi:hypothetical protein